ncbi:hypothetical protein HY030_02415 [Candidatus Gottesmanbacteria bacterium]|nr:hypothetical protein [Candidatus Gottesmanbacteria bacterium]
MLTEGIGTFFDMGSFINWHPDSTRSDFVANERVIPSTETERLLILERLREGKTLVIPTLYDPGQEDIMANLGLRQNTDEWLFRIEEVLSHDARTNISSKLPIEVRKSYEAMTARYDEAKEKTIQNIAKGAFLEDFLIIFAYFSTGKTASKDTANRFVKAFRATSLNKKITSDKWVTTIPAAFIGFAVDSRAKGQYGTNSQADTATFLKKLLTGDYQEMYSPLCAQYNELADTADKNSDSLVDHVNSSMASRTMLWQKMLVLPDVLSNRPINLVWSTLLGEPTYIESVIPSVVWYYGINNGLAKMMLLLDRHFYELRTISRENGSDIKITALEKVENKTESRLRKIFGREWSKIQLSDIKGKLEKYYNTHREDELLSLKTLLDMLAFEEVRDSILADMDRFYGQSRKAAQIFEKETRDLGNDVNNLTDEEWQEWCRYRRWNLLAGREQAVVFLEKIKQKIISQGEITNAARALHEAILYQELGTHCAKYGLLYIGLDIDHKSWQASMLSEGYNITTQLKAGIKTYERGRRKNPPTPIVYARKPKIPLTKDEKRRGVTTVMKYKMDSDRNLLQNFWLREDFNLT